MNWGVGTASPEGEGGVVPGEAVAYPPVSACRLDACRAHCRACISRSHESPRMRHEATLLHELIELSAQRTPERVALHDDGSAIGYAQLAALVRCFAGGLAALKVASGERVAIYLDKRRETVVASFGAPAHGAV